MRDLGLLVGILTPLRCGRKLAPAWCPLFLLRGGRTLGPRFSCCFGAANLATSTLTSPQKKDSEEGSSTLAGPGLAPPSGPEASLASGDSVGGCGPGAAKELATYRGFALNKPLYELLVALLYVRVVERRISAFAGLAFPFSRALSHQK